MKRTSKNEDVLMKYLGKLYQKYDDVELPSSMQIQENEESYYKTEFIIDMNRILKELPEIYAEIIKNDFLCSKDEEWWKKKYDKMTHEQLKNIAVEAFFHCLYT